MMSKTRVSLMAALAVACACGNAAAQSSIVLGNFEGANSSNTDGWDGQNGTTVANFNGFSTTATVGTGALAVTSPAIANGANGFVWSIMFDNGDRPTLAADIASHPILKADVTWVTSQWPDSTPGDGSSWAKWDIVAVNSAAGWQQTPNGAVDDTSNPAFPGSWDAVNYGAVNTRTVTWNLGGLPIDPASWAQLWMSVNRDTVSFPGQKVFWIDNIRLEVPEPATLGLAGLAGVALVALRRRMAA